MAAPMSEGKQLEDTNILGLPNVHKPQQVNITHVLSTRDYTLNVNRALRNKINACKEVKVEYELTGGGITGSMDTATFELFRAACRVFYTSFPEDQGFCEINDTDDKDGVSIVQTTYKIKRNIETGFTVGYTLNLYPTNNRLLLIGKDIDSFMNCHLPTLHEIMCTPIRNGQLRSLSQLNIILETQLQAILCRRQNIVVHTDNKSNELYSSETQLTSDVNKDVQSESDLQIVSDNVNVKPTPDPKCPGCSKNCLKRGAVCEAGNHWIHYRCDKLSEDEIKRLEKDPGFIYSCKRCRAENTIVKQPVHSAELKSDHSMKTVKTLTIPSLVHESPSNNVLSEAAGILEEEIGTLCCVCDDRIYDTETTCSKCNNSCHAGCATACDGTDQCIGCCATDNQLNKNNDINLENATVLDENINKNVDGIGLKTSNSQCMKINKGDNSNGNKDNSIIKHNKDVIKGAPSDCIPMKQRELRQLENKLRKWEDDLKMRESRLLEQNKENRRLEDYINKVEARNNELQHTVRTLQRRIIILEHDGMVASTSASINQDQNHYLHSKGQSADVNIKQNFNNHSNSRLTGETYQFRNNDNTDKLVAGVRDQVTSFILNRVSEQITMLERQCNEIKPTSNNVAHNLGEGHNNMYDTRVPGPRTSHVVPNSRDHHGFSGQNPVEPVNISHPMSLNYNMQQTDGGVHTEHNGNNVPEQQAQNLRFNNTQVHSDIKRLSVSQLQPPNYMVGQHTPSSAFNAASYFQGQPIMHGVPKAVVNNPTSPFLCQAPPTQIIR